MKTETQENDNVRGYVNDLIDLCLEWQIHPDAIRIIFNDFLELLETIEARKKENTH